MLSARLFLAIYDGVGGVMLADFQTRATGLTFSKNPHGCASASWSISCSLFEGFRLQGTLQGKHCEISASGHPVWNGRVEDVNLTETGVQITAFGYPRSLQDTVFTQFWSSTQTSEWEPVYTSQVSNRYPDRYRLGTQDGLFLALQRGDTYGNVNHVGSLMYRIPDQSGRNIYTFSFNWEITLPTGWQFVVETRTSAFGSSASTSIATGNGATQTGTSSLTLTANAIVMVSIYNNTGANYTATGETGSQYARLTGIRIKGTTSAALYADEIVRALVASVSGSNPGQLENVWTLIQSPALDLRDELYLDATPSDILDYLAALGDTSAPPRQWEWGVTIDQALYFRPRGSGRSWTIDAGSLKLQQSMDGLRNNAYATYQDANGRTLRTAASGDAISQKRYGITRTVAIGTQTSVNAQATTHRDAALADAKDPKPRTGFDGIRWIFDSSGMPYSPFLANAGDIISVRNVNPTSSADIDRVRTFVLSEMEFDADTGLATLTPEDPVPSLDVITARYSAGMGFVVARELFTERDPRQPVRPYSTRGTRR